MRSPLKLLRDFPKVFREIADTGLSYVVSTDGSRYYVKDGSGGIVEYSDSDASNAIQYAIDKVVAKGGGTVLLREGKYYLSKTVSIQNAVNVELRGMGMGKTVVTPDTDDPSWSPVILVNNSNYIRLTGFTIDQRRTKSISAPEVVVITNSNYVETSYLEITRYFPFALSFGRHADLSPGETPPFSPVSNIYVHHNFIHDSVQDCGGDGIKTYATKNAVITDNIILNSGDDCISIGGMGGYESHNYVIANNITAPGWCGNSIKLHTIYNQPPGDYPIRNVVIANNLAIPGSAGSGAIILSWESSQTTSNPIADVVIEGNRVERIRISGATRVHINGNIVGEEIILFPSADWATFAPQPMSDILITNNRVGRIVMDVSVYRKETQWSNIHIKGNVIKSTGTAIYIKANQIPISYVYIEDNHIVGTRGVQIDGTVGADYVYIYRNRFIASDYDLFLNKYVQDHVYVYDNDFSYRILDNPGMAQYRRNRGYPTENSGVATFSGDGATKQFTISHGLVKQPNKILVTPASADASGSYYVTADATYIYVNYITAPPAGTNNVVLFWSAEV